MSEIYTTPFFGIGLTIATYMIGRYLSKKINFSLANEMIIAIFLCIGVMWLFDISSEEYLTSSAALNFMIIPATIALAYQVYEQLAYIKAYLIPLLVGTIVGSVVSISTVLLLLKLFPLPPILADSLVPKSVTTAIAMEVSTLLGGEPSITILAVVFTGFTGVLINPFIIKVLKIKDPVVMGLGFGISAHVIGTAKAFEYGKIEGAMSSIAIFFTGIATVLVTLLFI